MTTELKPCPFCGGKDVEAFQQYPEDDGGMGSYIVRCHGCDAQSAQFIGTGKRDMAIRAWNLRHSVVIEQPKITQFTCPRCGRSTTHPEGWHYCHKPQETTK